MTVDSPWIALWIAVLCVGLGAFYLVVLAVIPLGLRDILRLLRQLDEASGDEPPRRAQPDSPSTREPTP